jgi:prepilin-type N-terminal cleavage/methylation domain-containing protein
MKAYCTPGVRENVRLGDERGFTLIEILIAIVLIGILSAVAVVGISNLVSKGSKSACNATRDAANSASAVFFASNSRYPINFTELTAPLPATPTILAPLTLPPSAAVGASPATTVAAGTSWTLTMSTIGTATVAPVFSVCT